MERRNISQYTRKRVQRTKIMQITKPQPENAEKLKSIALKTWKETYKDIFTEETIEEVVNDWYDEEDLKKQFEDPYFYIAKESGQLIGYIHATIEENVLKLHRLYILPDYWGQGIGTQLYEKITTEAKPNADKIKLEVLKQNKVGKNFYNSKGFRIQKIEDVELKGENATQLKMEKEL